MDYAFIGLSSAVLTGGATGVCVWVDGDVCAAATAPGPMNGCTSVGALFVNNTNA